MYTRLLAAWDRLRASYWFVPGLMLLSSGVLAAVTTRLDHVLAGSTTRFDVFASTPEGARAMLSTLAGAQITIAGLTFSITIVALTVAAQQFGPRLLRNFMRDVGNQVVLGTFVASFVYCVLVQGQIRGGDESTWVPSLSLAVAVGLALASLLVLVYFIHHVSASIHASELIALVGGEIDTAIDRLFPEEAGREDVTQEHDDPSAVVPDGPGAQVEGAAVGYVQAIDLDGLMALAGEHNLLLRLECRPGDRVVQGCPVATVWPQATDEIGHAINRALIVGTQRTPVQDLEFSIDQLVEIAVRALSPGINDPFTAMTCVDRLSAALCTLARRTIPSPVRRDDALQPRVVARPWTFRGALDAAFDQIRQHSRGTVAVMIRMVEGLALIARHARRCDDRAALRRQLDMIERGADAIDEPLDRDALHDRIAAARRMLQYERRYGLA